MGQPAVQPATEVPPSPAELVRRAAAGDRQALEGLLPESLINAAFSFVRHRLPSQEVAEDLLMEAVEAAIKGLPKFRGEASFATWLLGICRNKVADWHRLEAKRRTAPAPADFSDVPTVVAERERLRAVVAASDGLPTPLREVFWLRKAQGLSAAEVGELTGFAESTVHAYTSQACAQIRKGLAPQYPELRPPGEEDDD